MLCRVVGWLGLNLKLVTSVAGGRLNHTIQSENGLDTQWLGCITPTPIFLIGGDPTYVYNAGTAECGALPLIMEVSSSTLVASRGIWRILFKPNQHLIS
jgi:hypothetical protein